jgi:NAD(P)H-hydrate epimerase
MVILKYLSVGEMIAIEKEADASGLSYAAMMENAGRGLAEVVRDAYSHLQGRRVLGLVGSGNNGGDTLVALAHLAAWDWRADAYLARPRSQPDPLVEALRQAGGRVFSSEGDQDFGLLTGLIQSHELILDGVLGTGVRLPLKGDVVSILDVARRSIAALKDVHIVAVDCPSGVDCDSGEVSDVCIPADLTVSMAAAKRGLLKFPAYSLVGELVFVGIGLGEGFPYPPTWQSINRFIVDKEWVQGVMPVRPLDAHKGTFGTALVVAGSSNFAGAVLLAGEAAYRIGSGLVTLGIPESLYPALVGHLTEATWLLLPEQDGGIGVEAAAIVHRNLQRVTALLIGPGFGLRGGTQQFLTEFLQPRDDLKLPPVVIDADGLKHLAGIQGWPELLPERSVLTPHPGEMGVLTGRSVSEIQDRRMDIAESYAQSWRHVLVLKGAFTVIADPGGQTAIIPVASPALARAGTGDVLAGLITGLLAQGVDAFEASAAGAWIHAQAGVCAARRLGSSAAVIAGDLIQGVIEVMGDLSEK